MKKNTRIMLVAVAAYSYLFYRQNAGINFAVFNALLITLLLWRDRSLIRNQRWRVAAAACLTSSAAIFLNSTDLAVFANVCSLMLLSAWTIKAESSIVVSGLQAAWAIGTSVPHMIMDAIANVNAPKAQVATAKYRWTAIIAVMIACLCFFSVYQAANPIFAYNTRWLSLDFISLPWVLFTVFGTVLIYGLMFHWRIAYVDRLESSFTAGIDNAKPLPREEMEQTAGTWLFAALNLMLLLLNVGDIRSFVSRAPLPENFTLADFVHEGVGMVIFAVALGAALIMFLHRRNYQQFQATKALKALMVLWCAQTLLMLLSTAHRNHLYIDAYSLTYKRIGVDTWLLLAFVGLCTMLIKLFTNRSAWYVVRVNVATWFFGLLAASLINWDVFVTRYNLTHKPVADVDYYYLFSLSDANLPDLIELSNSPDLPLIQKSMAAFDPQGDHRSIFADQLERKMQSYIRHYSSDWQSFDLRDRQITKAIMAK